MSKFQISDKRIMEKISSQDLILFREQKFRSSSTLRQLMAVLKTHVKTRPLSFFYVPQKGEFNRALSLEKNILHDTVPMAMQSHRDFSLEKYALQNLKEEYFEIFSGLPFSKSPGELKDSEIKLAMIFKALIHPGKYLLFECPETHISPRTFQLILDALEFRLKSENKVALVYPAHPERWDGKYQKLAYRNDQGRLTLARPAAMDAREASGDFLKAA